MYRMYQLFFPLSIVSMKIEEKFQGGWISKTEMDSRAKSGAGFEACCHLSSENHFLPKDYYYF